MADIIIREKDGKEEIWYSKEYFSKHLKKSFYAGVRKGIGVEIHTVQPMDNIMVENLIEEFNRRVQETIDDAYEKGEIPYIK